MTSPFRSPARSLSLSLLALAALASCARPVPAPPAAAPPPPPAATAAKPAAAQMFVVAANPLASEAGMAVLRRGGSAVDAAIAVQAMLSLVEPQSSGIGGGAFLNYFNAETRKAEIYDGRETAPAGASPDMFLGDNGKPLGYPAAVTSGRATGVPGVVRMLKIAHDEHGSLEWRTLFGDAERTARDGFVVSARLGRFLTRSFPQLASPDAQAYFAKGDGTLVGAGDRLKNPAYADFLTRLAAQGPDALYAGPTAQAIVARTKAAPLGGTMTLADLTAYRPIKREPLCRDWRVYLVCVPPPPSSGVGMLQLLLMLERTDIASRNAQDPQAWFLFAEASRIMYADRDRYVGDPLASPVPVEGLLAPDYIARRAALIGTVAGAPPAAGTPAGAVVAAADTTAEPAGTSHFIVGDSKGNVVSMTTTVESIFGTGRMVDGFFLNNQMTDFAFSPRDAQGRAAVNAVAPGKRPRSSMTPLVMIDRQGRFAGALGSAGGNAILAYVGKSMIGAVDWGLTMQQALALPNLVARGDNFGGEVTRFSPELMEMLAARGVKIVPGQGEDSGLHGVIVRNGRIDGGYDPRREGRVLVEAGAGEAGSAAKPAPF